MIKNHINYCVAVSFEKQGEKMVQSIFEDIAKNYYSIIKITFILIVAVLAGVLLPQLFSEEIVSYMDEISNWLMQCLQGKETFVYSGFVNNVLLYGSILVFLWLIGCNMIAVIPSIFVLAIYGLLEGIVFKIVFSLGFAYGILLFLLNILPANLLISFGFILQVSSNLSVDKSFSRHSTCFFLSFILIISGCFYLTFIGPKLLEIFLNFI